MRDRKVGPNWVMERSAKPTTRPDTSALVVGDQFLLTTDGSRWIWNGTYWLSEGLLGVGTARMYANHGSASSYFHPPILADRGIWLEGCRYSISGPFGGNVNSTPVVRIFNDVSMNAATTAVGQFSYAHVSGATTNIKGFFAPTAGAMLLPANLHACRLQVVVENATSIFFDFVLNLRCREVLL